MCRRTLPLVVGVIFFAVQGAFAQMTMMGGCTVNLELGSNVEVCSSVSIMNLSGGTPMGGTYSGTGVLDNFFFPSIAGPGQHIITYSYDDGICIGNDTDTITVVAPIPTELDGDFQICMGDTTVITALNNHDWEWESGSNAMSESYSPDETTSYTMYAFDENGCLAATGFTIGVDTLPILSVTGDTSICIGEATTLTAHGAEFYFWEVGLFTASVVLSPIMDSVYLVKGVDGNGCSNGVTAFIDVHDLPVIHSSGDNSICQNETAAIQLSGAAQYFVDGEEINALWEVSPSDTTEFEVTGISDAGCSSTALVTINVSVAPQIFISGDDELCLGEQSIFTIYTEDALTFQVLDENNNQVILAGDTIHLPLAPSNTTFYSVVAVSPQSCITEESFDIVVHPHPVLNIEGDPEICVGETIELTVSGAEDYLWSNQSTDNPLIISPTTSSNLGVTGTDQFGCSSSSSVAIVVHTIPLVAINGDHEICTGESSTLTAMGAVDYVWFDESTGTQLIASPDTTTVITVTGTDQFGCVDVANFTLEVHPYPVVTIGGDLILCLGETALLEASGAETYIWNGEDTGNTLLIEEPIDGMEVTIVGTDEFGCSNTASAELEVFQFPALVIEGDNEICAGETIVLTASGANEFLWNLQGETSNTLTDTPLTTTTYSVTGTNGGCPGDTEFTVTVYQLPAVYFSFNLDSICDEGEALSWTVFPIGGDFSGSGVDDNMFNPSLAPVGTNVITYTYTDIHNCTASYQDDIYVDDCSSVGELSSSTVLLYPNPASQKVILSSNGAPIAQVSIMDETGRCVEVHAGYQGTLVTLDIAHLSGGIYFLDIQTVEGMVTRQRMVRN